MQIENLTLVGGLTLTGNPFPVQSNCLIELRPSSYIGTGTVWNNAITAYSNLVGNISGNPEFNPSTGFSLINNWPTTEQKITLTNDSILNFTSSMNYSVEVWFNYNLNTDNQDFLVTKYNYDGTAPSLITCCDLSISGPLLNRLTATAFSSTDAYQFSQDSLLAPNIWFQVVSVFDWLDQKLRVYRNGVLINGDTQLGPGGNVTNNLPWTIGARPVTSGSQQGLNGNLGIFRLYNKALTSFELYKNFEADRSIFGI